jgi:hypothetical protein
MPIPVTISEIAIFTTPEIIVSLAAEHVGVGSYPKPCFVGGKPSVALVLPTTPAGLAAASKIIAAHGAWRGTHEDGRVKATGIRPLLRGVKGSSCVSEWGVRDGSELPSRIAGCIEKANAKLASGEWRPEYTAEEKAAYKTALVETLASNDAG